MKIILHPIADSQKNSNYRIIDKQVDALADDQQYDQALTLLQSMKQNFPTRLADTYNYRFWLFDQLNQRDNKMAELLEAADKNIFFPVKKYYKNGISDLLNFNQICALSEQKLATLNQQSESKLEIYLPQNISNIQSLLLILHGDGQTNESIYEVWPANPYLDKGIAVAYLQSPTVFCSHGFYWTDDYQTGRLAIEQAFHQIQIKLDLQPSQIVLAGFSGGAMAAISALTYGEVTPQKLLAFMPHNGDFVGTQANSNTEVHIFKAEFDKNIDDLLQSVSQLIPTHLNILNGLEHSLPNDMASHVLPHMG